MPLEIPDIGPADEQNRLLPATLEDRLVRLIGRAGGVTLILALALLWLTLLSWSVNDPSLTFATGGRTQNALGALGAIVSDLLLQMLGFAAAIALLAPMVWAIELTFSERVQGFRAKASFYPLSIIVLAGALSTLPVPQSWPLHHAMGGILGDVVTHLGATLFGIINPERAHVATGIVLFGAGFATLLMSLGLEVSDLAKLFERSTERPVPPAADGLFDRVWQSISGKREPTLPGPAQLDTQPFHHAYGHGASDAWFAAQADAQAYAAYQQGYAAAQHLQADAAGTHPGYQPQIFAHGPAASPAPRQAAEAHLYAAHYDPVYGSSAPPPPHNGYGYGFGADAGHAPMDGSMAAPQFLPAPREAEFDVATDLASRNIAERFAPACAREARAAAHAPMPAPAPVPIMPTPQPVAAAAPMPAPTEPQASTPKPGSGFLSGLAFRRAEPAYKRPSLNLLKRATAARAAPELTQTALRGSARLLEDTLADFGVKAEVRDIKPGPVVTLFEVEPARGTKSARIIGLADDIARSMSAASVRVAVVPGRNAIGIELPNARRETVLLREILEAEAFKSGEAALPVALGKGIDGGIVVADLARMPHLLVAGTTGSGKSVGVNAMILSLLYRHAPEDCRMIMIDPKMLELSVYNGIPHLLTPVVTDPAKAVAALNWAVHEMEERYKRMARLNVRNIDVYNNRVRNAKKRGEMMSRTVQTGFDRKGEAVYEKQDIDVETMPYIVVVVDEFADLMIVAGKEIEAAVQRLAQMARAAGIHLIMATQRPSVDIITGTIKANFPTRISFKVTSKIDSRTIINDQGAEQLLGQGDMLYSTGAGQVARVHGPFVSDEEVEQIAKFLAAQGQPKYVAGITEGPETEDRGAADGQGRPISEDDLYDRAVAVVLRDRKPSTSYIQRRLSIGYNRAADLIERMEREGIVSAASGSGKREILAADTGPGGAQAA